MHYLDNASTTMVAPGVAAVADTTLRAEWANPSALYRAGAKAEAVITRARGVLAGALGCTAKEVVFTGSGSEANNLALLGAARVRKSWGNQLVTTGYEHPSVLEALRMLAAREGFVLTAVDPRPDGTVDLTRLLAAVGPKTVLVSAMQVNNETGAVLDVTTLAAGVKAKNPRCFVHVDGVQAFCKQPLNLSATKIDSYAVSGHKLHAPKGVGALFMRSGGNFAPLMAGGRQEGGVRPGTENTAYIVAFARAVELALESRQKDAETVAGLRAQLLHGLEAIGGMQIHSPAGGAPGIVMFSLPRGYRSEMMIHHLDEGYDVQVSSGSACHGGQPSQTLLAMGVPDELVDTALRVGLCGQNTSEDLQALLAGLEAGLRMRASGRPGGR